MKDEYLSIIAGALVIAGLRVLDWFLPKGRQSKWSAKHSVEVRDERDEDEENDYGRSM